MNPSKPESKTDQISRIEELCDQCSVERNASNARMENIVDRIRIQQTTFQKDVYTQQKNVTDEMSQIREALHEITHVLKGAMGGQGMVNEHIKLRQDVDNIIKWKSNSIAYIGGVASMITFIGTLIIANISNFLSL